MLHDSLDAAGVATAHARSAREGFAAHVGRLTRVSAGTSIAMSRGVDLARAALCVAAKDDSLVSHSSVALPGMHSSCASTTSPRDSAPVATSRPPVRRPMSSSITSSATSTYTRYTVRE